MSVRNGSAEGLATPEKRDMKVHRHIKYESELDPTFREKIAKAAHGEAI